MLCSTALEGLVIVEDLVDVARLLVVGLGELLDNIPVVLGGSESAEYVKLMVAITSVEVDISLSIAVESDLADFIGVVDIIAVTAVVSVGVAGGAVIVVVADIDVFSAVAKKDVVVIVAAISLATVVEVEVDGGAEVALGVAVNVVDGIV